MKIVLETIPLWDALKENTECPICTLMKKAEEDSIKYYLSSAIMTSEVRIETNTYGFCPHHYTLLTERGNPQSLALTMDTYYRENEKCFRKGFDEIAGARKEKEIRKALDKLERIARERESGCLICSKMDERLYRYAYTLASLSKSDVEFRKAFLSSKGLCLHHTFVVSRIASDAVKGGDYISFQKDLFSLLEQNLERVREDDVWMTQKYKSENKDKPWNGAEDAHKRAVFKLIGEGRVIDPVRK